MTPMSDHRSGAVTGLTSLAAVCGVAGIYAVTTVSAVSWALVGPVAGVLAAGLLVWTASQAVSRPTVPTATSLQTSLPTSVRASTRPRPGASGAARMTAPVAPRAPEADPAQQARDTWAEATARHDRVLTDYGRWELDPRMLLSYPALWNYALPENQEFFSALERTSQLRTAVIPGGHGHPDVSAVETFDTVTRRLRKAWAIAEQNARRTGIDDLTGTLHKDAERALKLLNHADGASTDAEAVTYLTQASCLVQRLADRGVIPAHTGAAAELERRRVRAITAGPMSDGAGGR